MTPKTLARDCGTGETDSNTSPNHAKQLGPVSGDYIVNLLNLRNLVAREKLLIKITFNCFLDNSLISGGMDDVYYK